MDLNGANVLLTGASSGIGAALAPQLAARGATVGLVARRADRLAEVLDACKADSPDSRIYPTDLSDLDAAEALALQAWDEMGPIDVLVNNAGTPKRRKVLDLTPDEIARVMSLNFHSPVRMTLALLPKMVERATGTIVNVSSVVGRMGVPTEAAYCASKFALTGWSEAMALDLWHTGVKVRLINPGAIETEIWEQPENDPPLYKGELEPAENVAAGIADAIEGDTFEHWLPDMKGIIEFKTSKIDEFFAGTVAFQDQQAQNAG